LDIFNFYHFSVCVADGTGNIRKQELFQASVAQGDLQNVIK